VERTVGEVEELGGRHFQMYLAVHVFNAPDLPVREIHADHGFLPMVHEVLDHVVPPFVNGGEGEVGGAQVAGVGYRDYVG